MAKRARPSIPRLPASIKDHALRTFLDKLREATEVNSGFQGDPLDRAVTHRDMRDIGLVSRTGVPFTGGGGSTTTVIGGGGGSTDLDVLTPPSAPTNVYVTATTQKVFIGWDKPTENHVAYTEIWKVTLASGDPDPVRADAYIVGTSPGMLFADSVEPLTRHFYWVRHVSHMGVEGAWNATAGLEITTPNTPANYLNILSDQINESHLTDVLAGRIDLIDLPNTGLIDRLAEETADRIAAINQEVTDRTQAVNAESAARIAALANEANQRTTDLANEIQSRIDGDANIQGQVDTLVLDLDDTNGAVNATLARINAIGGSAVDLESFYLDYDAFKTSVNTTAGNATAAYNKAVEVETRIDEVDGVGLSIENFFTSYESLAAEINHGTTGLAAAYNNGVTLKNRVDSVDGSGKTVEQFFSDFSVVSLAVNDGNTGLAATLQSLTNLENRADDIGGNNKTLEQFYTDFEAVELQVNDGTTGLAATRSKATTLENRLATVDGATKTIEQFYQDFDTVALEVADGTTGLSATRTDFLTVKNRVNTVDGATKTIEQFYTDYNTLALAVNHGTTGLAATRDKGTAIENRLAAVDGGSKSLEQFFSDFDTVQLAVNDGSTGLAATRSTATSATNRLNSVDGGGTTIESMWTSYDTLANQVNHGTTGLSAAISRLSSAENRLNSTGTGQSIESIASDFLALEGTINDNSLGLSATYQKAVSAQSTANAAEQTATTVSNEVLAARGGEASLDAQLTVMKQVSTDLGALWSATLDVNGYIAGFGVYNDGNTALARFNVDQFAIASPGSTELSFVVDGNNVVMDGAFIQDATITNAKIDNITVDKIVGDTANFVNSNIVNGSISNAKIGNIIQSDSYIPGVQGWRVNKLGGAEFHDITVYDGDGRVAFKTGENYLISVDDTNDISVNDNVYFEEFDTYVDTNLSTVRELPSYYNYERDGYGILDTDAELSDNKVYRSFGQLKIGDDNIGYTVSSKLISLTNAIPEQIEVNLYAGNGSRTYTLKVYEHDSFVSEGVHYFSENYTNSATIIPDRVLTLDTINVNGQGTLSSTYTPTVGTRSFSIAVVWESGSGADHTFISAIHCTGKAAQISSTYIADAAITKAKIGEAAVDTLKISDNAVTVIQIAEFADGSQSNSSWKAAGSFVVNHGHSENVLMLFDVSATLRLYDGEQSAIARGSLRFDVDGVSYISEESHLSKIKSGSFSVGNSTFMTAFTYNLVRVRKAITIPPGNHLVEIYARGSEESNGGEGVRYYGLTASAMAAKR